MVNPSHKRLTVRILIAMVLGIALGIVTSVFAPYPETGSGLPVPALQAWTTDGLFLVIGKMFIRGLTLLVVPVVLVSLISGTAALDDVRRLGRVGIKALGLYLTTTAIALILAIGVAVLVQPGAGFPIPADITYSPPESKPLTDVFIEIVPANPFESVSTGNMLQVIVFSILAGLALTMAGAPGKRILAIVDDLNAAVMKLVEIIIWLTPYGVFALIFGTFAKQGAAGLGPIAAYFATVLGVLLLHMFLTYPSLLVLARLSPLPFLRKMLPVQLFAFSTASSNATIPFNLENVEKRLGAHNSIASFSIPLGATINMDGTAIMQGVATVFIAQAYGVEMTVQQYLVVILTATLASIGTAGIPSVGLVMLAMVLKQVGLPVEGIALIIGIDRLLDMVRTAVNVTGDAAVTCVVAKSEGELDAAVYGDGVTARTPQS